MLNISIDGRLIQTIPSGMQTLIDVVIMFVPMALTISSILMNLSEFNPFVFECACFFQDLEYSCRHQVC